MELVQFLGWKGCYALFSIKREILPNGEGFDKILVAHEGHWIDSDGMMCHPEYEHYEDVQKDLGKGLHLLGKSTLKF